MSEPITSVASLDNLEERVPAGTERFFRLTVSESYNGVMVRLPIVIRRAPNPGPTVCVTAAIHGNEINGTGAIRQLIRESPFELTSGMLIMIPIVNVQGFEAYSRYLPDRRDLNRSFPGSASGSMASRLANKLFTEVVQRCDYGIDLHTASVRRTNFPNVRGDFSVPAIRDMGKAFGCQWMLNSRGPLGSFRREAMRAGVPTIILEAGEVCKVEPSVLAVAVHGVSNVLSHLGMTDQPGAELPPQQIINKTLWVRAERGGFLEFHVSPGEVVRKDQPLATNNSLFGAEHNVLVSPIDAVVIGMTTLPAATPGEPVIHLGQIPTELAKSITSPKIESESDPLHDQAMEDLATNIMVTSREEDVED
ncbi:aspartoacylase [Roseimaritima multifibrata]|uniref:Aspartoacylase n=1 Tax=Roseimaritima multifibrata TaxID=1930274 RepID=A0A517MAN2_9BACT|nr:succinylglutamate desuccinylase/aspartoacylase family protein [Roseimaritima multifibrata]QDS91943.1 aspartoacylase [Roseimaritima multifibrata]